MTTLQWFLVVLGLIVAVVVVVLIVGPGTGGTTVPAGSGFIPDVRTDHARPVLSSGSTRPYG